MRRRLAAAAVWLLDRLTGAPCPASCGYISRGDRTLHDHLEHNERCRAIHAANDTRQGGNTS